ncbi:MAG: biotin transporter BioY [candidate division NC10 bacterium]|nr:biotin transporter BioY [candidate division NC10 bacterium]
MPAKTETLTDAIFPATTLWRDVALIAAFSLMTGLAAQVSIPLPFTPVPITGQTFAVLLTGALLGSRRGALSILLYLGEGAAGLPVFAGGTGGFSRFIGPTGGYLIGFVVAAYLVGALAERGWDRRFWRAVVAMLVGEGAIYLFGLLWLARFVPSGKVFSLGMLPFLPGDLIKLILAATALPSAWAILRRLGLEK